MSGLTASLQNNFHALTANSQALDATGRNLANINNSGYSRQKVLLGSLGSITTSSGTGHLQKGHGISFADWNSDGSVDLFVETGGAVPGDRSYNLLFQNPGQGNHWLKVKLVGTKTNRAAIGARIRAVIEGTDGTTRTVYRTVGNNSSFGGNTLVETIGLRDATRLLELHVDWPTSQITQTFREISADQAIQITEGVETWKSSR